MRRLGDVEIHAQAETITVHGLGKRGKPPCFYEGDAATPEAEIVEAIRRCPLYQAWYGIQRDDGEPGVEYVSVKLRAYNVAGEAIQTVEIKDLAVPKLPEKRPEIALERLVSELSSVVQNHHKETMATVDKMLEHHKQAMAKVQEEHQQAMANVQTAQKESLAAVINAQKDATAAVAAVNAQVAATIKESAAVVGESLKALDRAVASSDKSRTDANEALVQLLLQKPEQSAKADGPLSELRDLLSIAGEFRSWMRTPQLKE